MIEVAATIRAVILWGLEIQRQQLVALSRVLQLPLVRGFNLQIGTTTVDAVRATGWPRIDLNRVLTIDRVDGKLTNA